ncbi:hypothetical protein KR032_005555, partial [Drosophila birchii]
SEMNVFKKSPVLNRQCLRNKIEELSPLVIKQLNLGICNKDSVFRTTWDYYASGCQERLTSIRRRIEQNAKMVTPRTQHCQNLNPSPTESSLTPGVDLEDHIYHELVSCFRGSDEGLAKAKNPPKRSAVKKELNSVQCSTLEEWYSWKREEREVRQVLMQCHDPYRVEELTRKLQKLKKLTNRHPFVAEPYQQEEPTKSASKITKTHIPKKSVRSLPEVIPKPGPYVNRSAKSAINSAGKAARFWLDIKNERCTETPEKQRSLKAKLLNKKKLKILNSLREDESRIKVKNKRHTLKNITFSATQDSGLTQEKGRETKSLRTILKNPQSSQLPEVPEPRDESHDKVEKQKQRKEPVPEFIPSSSSDLLLVKPRYKPHKPQYSYRLRSIRKAHSWHWPRYMKYKANLDWNKKTYKKTKQRNGRKSKIGHRLDSVRKTISWPPIHPRKTYSPLKARINQNKPITASKTKTKTKTQSKFHYDWPLPRGMKHTEYFKPYGQFKTKDQVMKPVQTFPHLYFITNRKMMIPKAHFDLPKSPESTNSFQNSDFNIRARRRLYSTLYGKPISSSDDSSVDLSLPPMIISDIINEFMNKYGSKINFKNPFTNFMKPNKLDRLSPKIAIKKPQPKMARKDKIIKKKAKKKSTKKVQKKPSKREPTSCSLCNLVRRRQSELRPFMKRMQMERQRLELQTYYTQNILKKPPSQEQFPQAARRALTCQVLARCYQTLNLCQKLLEQRLLQRS